MDPLTMIDRFLLFSKLKEYAYTKPRLIAMLRDFRERVENNYKLTTKQYDALLKVYQCFEVDKNLLEYGK